MKVLYLVPQPRRPDRIGAYTFLDEEIQALATAGIDAYVLSTATPTDRWCGGVRLKSADARRSIANRFGSAAFLVKRRRHIPPGNLRFPLMGYRSARLENLAATLVHEERIDLIHSHFAWPIGYGGLLARAATGRPLVASLRGTDILVDRSIGYGRRVHPFFDSALRVLLRAADRTVYFSQYMRDHGVSLGATPDTTRVIRKGVDLNHFTVAEDRLALQRELGFGGRPMILTVAGLMLRKGIHHILQSLSVLRHDHDFVFVICGDGEERGRLEALSAELGLGDRTVFMGRVDRATVPKFFAACDVFVLGSIMEAAGNVLFEAMASGRPLVCTDSGGPGEYVTDGETGFVVPVGDHQAMAQRIRLLLENPALRERIGREAHRRTLGQFSYDRMVSDLIRVYDEVLTAERPQRMAV